MAQKQETANTNIDVNLNFIGFPLKYSKTAQKTAHIYPKTVSDNSPSIGFYKNRLFFSIFVKLQLFKNNQMEEREPVISLRNADICGGENTVLYGVDMDVYPGDFLYIVGKVGTGKTSIIRTMIAESRLTSGEGRVCGFDLRSMKDKEIPFLRRHLGVVFQDFQLLMDRSVEENLVFVLKATGWKNRDDINRRIPEVLEAVGMSHKAHRMPHQLSGGEQQRVAIARALLNRPEVILADEPTGNLDSETAVGIMDLLTSINRERGTAIVMVTHNLALLGKYPGRVMVCKDETCTEADAENTGESI